MVDDDGNSKKGPPKGFLGINNGMEFFFFQFLTAFLDILFNFDRNGICINALLKKNF
jgi:hypothetical protein